MSIKELNKPTGSKAEKIVKNVIIFLGLFTVIAVLFKPYVSYFDLSAVENKTVSRNDLFFLVGGFTAALKFNELGSIINNILKLFFKNIGFNNKKDNATN